MNFIYIYIIKYMNEMYIYVIRLCFISETECKFLSSSDGGADVSLLIATVDHSSDEQMI
jgi:hypothetical protein